MSWLWGSKKDDDPTKSLDRDLKQFLDSQTSSKHAQAQPEPQQRLKTETSKILTPLQPHEQTLAPQDRPLPKESLFQDGRYKDLWRTYAPQANIEAVNESPAERVVQAKKERSTSLTQAAQENCAFEEELKRNCYAYSDTWNRLRATMTLCNKEAKAYNRCFQLQAKFMQALGYQGTDKDTDEKIQMHADKLYHRMMDYEVAVDEARAKGEPVPPLASVFNPNRPAPTIKDLDLPPNLAKGLKKPLYALPPHERELEARAVIEETKVAQKHADDFFAFTTTLNEGRKQRQKKLVDAFGESLGKFFIPDAPGEDEVMSTFNPKSLERDFWKDDPKPGD